MKNTVVLRNILGAFSDGAVLFPLLALLSLKAGFSGSTVLFTTGIAYIVSSVIFRVPMAVQPLKSIAVAAITMGATFQEVRLSGLFLGLFCLVLCICKVDLLAKRVPAAIIHQLQVGLGVLLICQGAKAFGDWTIFVSSASGASVLAAIVFMVIFPEVRGLPVLGLVAALGLIAAVFTGNQSPPVTLTLSENSVIRPQLIAGLLIPQLALTLSNSVLATRDVCNRYFGNNASRVSIRRLLYSIGLGNVLVALVGGMPFCHGSGGVTAHARGGASQSWSTGLMGLLLIVLSLIQLRHHSNALTYPPTLVTILLIATGVFHLKLAAPTAVSTVGWIKLTAAFFITVLTRNLLWVLSVAILAEALCALFTAALESGKQVNTEVRT